MKKTAVMIDGGFLRVKIKRALRTTLKLSCGSLYRADGSMKQIHDLISPRDYVNRVVTFAKNCIDSSTEEIYRVFYYDCPPYAGMPSKFRPHPLGVLVPISEPLAVEHQTKVLNLLRMESYFAVRTGELSFDGWVPIADSLAEVIKTGRAFVATDFKPQLRQKGVDLKIGVDSAMMARDSLVERIVLAACDSDLVPAMKLARREGVQIVLVSLGAAVKRLLREHADLYRAATY
jgi:uncharacterized LabA/DUF88 family protein